MIVYRYKKISVLFVLFAIVYLAQSILISPDQATLDKYDISAGEAAWLSLTIAVPYIVIWFIALVGYLRLRAYVKPIKKSPDGAGFNMISKGIFWLALWLPITAIISGMSTHYYNANPATTNDLIIINNYLNIALLLPAFALVYLGSKKLVSLVKVQQAWYSEKAILLYISFAALYVYLVLQDPSRLTPTGSSDVATYYLEDWAIVLTLIIPRLIMWFLGLQAVLNIYAYQKKVKGEIYKQALTKLAWGIGGVVIAVIVLRCLQSLSSQLNDLGLGMLLILLYILLIILSIGYVFIASGAKKLKRIEDS